MNTRVAEVRPEDMTVLTSAGTTIRYDTLVLATGSDAVLPRFIPGHDANGVFVYRTILDLQNLIAYANEHRGSTGVAVGGGLLGLEAAKAMLDLETFPSVKILERGGYLLSRQLDEDAGKLVAEKVRGLGLDVMMRRSIAKITTDENNNVKGVVFETGEEMECSTICFAVSSLPVRFLVQELTTHSRSAYGQGTSWPIRRASRRASGQAGSPLMKSKE